MHRRDFRLEEGIVVKVEVPSDCLAVVENFLCLGIFLDGHVTRLLKERQVDVALNVASGAGISVPVPGPAEVSALFDHADIPEAGFTKACPCQQTAKAAADDDDVHLISQGLPVDFGADIGVFDISGILIADFDILLIAI